MNFVKVRFRYWAKLIAYTGFAQAMVQAIGLVSGIIVIRMLPVHEYALYTLANTMLGAMTVLADGGIAAGVLSESGKIWKDREKLGAVISTGMILRKKFAIFSLAIALPLLFFLLRKHDASWLMSTLIVLSLIPAFFSSLSGSLLAIPAKLHQDIKPLQRYQVEANIGRLALLGLIVFIFPFAAVAVICSGVSQVWNNWRLRTLFLKYADNSKISDFEAKAKIYSVVSRVMPGTIFYAVYGQFSVFLLSIFGTIESIAHIGALGRIAAIAAIGSMVFNIMVVPRFARYQQDANKLLSLYLAIHGVLLIFLAASCVLSYMLSTQILWILGPDYAALKYELLLAVVSSMLGMISGVTNGLNASRGFFWRPEIFYSVIIFVQAIIISNLSFTTVSDALFLGCVTGLVSYILNIGYGLYRLRC